VTRETNDTLEDQPAAVGRDRRVDVRRPKAAGDWSTASSPRFRVKLRKGVGLPLARGIRHHHTVAVGTPGEERLIPVGLNPAGSRPACAPARPEEGSTAIRFLRFAVLFLREEIQRLTAEEGDPAAIGRPCRVVVVNAGRWSAARAGRRRSVARRCRNYPGLGPFHANATRSPVGRKRRRAFETRNRDELDRPKRLLRLRWATTSPREKTRNQQHWQQGCPNPAPARRRRRFHRRRARIRFLLYLFQRDLSHHVLEAPLGVLRRHRVTILSAARDLLCAAILTGSGPRPSRMRSI